MSLLPHAQTGTGVTEGVRSTESVTDDPLENIDFMDDAVNDCPYVAYQRLRDEAPVWQDSHTGMWLVTRYVDVRTVLTDSERFSSDIGSAATRREATLRPVDPNADPALARRAGLAERITQLYETTGWMPAANMAAVDDPSHMERRRVFEDQFRAESIAAMDPMLESIVSGLLADLGEAGETDLLESFAVPFPLTAIGRIVGVPDADLEDIKRWTGAYVSRLNLRGAEEDTLRSVQLEIEMQHYFQRRFEVLRLRPDDSFLSRLVNTVVPEWGRPMTDEELHGELMTDLFVGGAETTTNAIAEGVVMLARDHGLWERLAADPSGTVPVFLEEVLRLESPVQSLMRKATCDIEMGDVVIPAGSIVNVRYGAANRDERAFADADQLNLQRTRPRRHLAFGIGAHHCLGAGLARRELLHAFRQLVEQFEPFVLAENADLSHNPNYFLRSMRELRVEYRRR